MLVLIPSLNPDGQRLVTEWYERMKGTPYEGGPMPWLYHKYAGHDINRDAFMMNLAENRNLARFFYSDWHPQVFLTMHQMEHNGPRFFVPPNTDPIDPNYDPLIWRSAALLGEAMALEMQRDRRSGVVSSAKYDYYWPGFEDSAPLGHNTVCLLTEVASVDVASPINVPATELRGGFKGLPGLPAADQLPRSLARRALDPARHRRLRPERGAGAAVRGEPPTANSSCRTSTRWDCAAVERGRQGGPFAFIIPPEQQDPHTTAKLEELLLARSGMEIQRALEPFRADGEPYPEGYRHHLPDAAVSRLREDAARTPELPGAPGVCRAAQPERPYDVAGMDAAGTDGREGHHHRADVPAAVAHARDGRHHQGVAALG